MDKGQINSFFKTNLNVTPFRKTAQDDLKTQTKQAHGDTTEATQQRALGEITEHTLDLLESSVQHLAQLNQSQIKRVEPKPASQVEFEAEATVFGEEGLLIGDQRFHSKQELRNFVEQNRERYQLLMAKKEQAPANVLSLALSA